MHSFTAVLTTVGTAVLFGSLAVAAPLDRPNVLMILVDDLKPALGCYGDEVAQTPRLDAIAARGMRFDLAYCNQAVCAPSRYTLMLGSHSTSTGLYRLGNPLRQTYPDAVTLPQYFARHGYHTESLGKVFHIGHGNRGDPESFDVPHFHDKVIEYLETASTRGGQLTREEAYFTNRQLGRVGALPRGAAFESPDVHDEAYADGRVAAETVRRLQAAKARRDEDGTPFLIVAGFARPHLPFSAPRRYWDRFDPARLSLPERDEPPRNAPAVAGKRRGEITNYAPVPPDGNIETGLARSLIHGYYASTSYVDAQIGKVIAEVDRLGLAENTIITVWGDHGFHLGDLGIWTKHTNYEQANRIPLLVIAPGITTPGASTRQLAQSVDLFPTLAELAGLPVPDVPQPLDGVSLVPVLKDPSHRVRDHAYHVYPKRKLGRAIRTERYRLVEWRNPSEPPETAEVELYDYDLDPLETTNLASVEVAVVKRLQTKLAAYPPPAPLRGRSPAVREFRDANPLLENPRRAFEHIPSKPRQIVVRQGDTELPPGGHFQGIQARVDHSRRKQVSFLSRDSQRRAYFLTVEWSSATAAHGDPAPVADVRHLQYLPSDGGEPPLRHPGGMQLAGDFLAIGVEDNQARLRSEIQFWDVSDPVAPQHRKPLTVKRVGDVPKDKTAGAVGLARRNRDHVLVVANWDARDLDFYTTNGRSLGDDRCRFTWKARWSASDAVREDWTPDRDWGNYQAVNLVCDRQFHLYLLAFCTASGDRDTMDLYRIDLSRSPPQMLRKIGSSQFDLSPNVHFRAAAGVRVASPTQLECYAMEGHLEGTATINVSP